jgi:tRNA 2-thiouridine synthesizing protein D
MDGSSAGGAGRAPSPNMRRGRRGKKKSRMEFFNTLLGDDMATITIGLMDPPLESTTVPSAFRIIDTALRKGHNVNVFLYEGAVGLGSTQLRPHADPVKGTSAEDTQHPTTTRWVEALFALAKEKNVTLQWVNCGLCQDERGLDAQVPGARKGSPADIWTMAEASDGFLFIATK